jgi:hypothetical protein
MEWPSCRLFQELRSRHASPIPVTELPPGFATKKISLWCSGTEQPLLGRCTCHCFDPLSDSLWATVLTEQVMSEGF